MMNNKMQLKMSLDTPEMPPLPRNSDIGIWFPTVRTGTGTDTFTERLVDGLNNQGIQAGITWLPLRAEYAPWSVTIPIPPKWATIAHVNTWLNYRFLPKNLPLIATLHHSIHDPELQQHKGWLRQLYHQYWIAPNERKVLHRANHVVAVSKYVANMAQKTLCDIPIQVIYNGVDTNKYKPDYQQKKPNTPFRLLYVGAWKKLKGIDLLAPIMRELGDDYVLHYTGGKMAENDKINMPKNMYDLGRLSDSEVIKAMQNADALLFPSRSEGLPFVAIEAMACGLPILGSDIKPLIEVVNNTTGFLFSLKDQNLLFNFLSNKRSDLETMRMNARSSIEKQFSNKQMIINYYNCYRTIQDQNMRPN